VSILTKSDLVLRDLDIISEKGYGVNVTVTTIDDRVSKRTEPGAPLPSRRLAAVTQLVEQGIDTTVMVGPIMSSLQGMERELADAIIGTGVKRASLDKLNPRPLLSERLDRMGIGASPRSVELIKKYLSDAGIFVEDAF
ncbi:MAG: radical SAM protein, partial [Candidatus Methanomethylophilaceae archaeon]|nr:radical SAM protein [Candidatus Methanomethylophilaceae archaeon]